jgi:ubiquinone biosynthesis protein
VVRPGVRQRFKRDLEAFYLVSELQERFIPSSRRLRPVEITKTLEQTTRIEMDLRLEAAALSEMADNTKDDPGFRVPRSTGSAPAAMWSPWNGSTASR